MVFNFHKENAGYSPVELEEPMADSQEILNEEARLAFETGETAETEANQSPDPQPPNYATPWWFNVSEDDDLGGPSSG